MSFYIQQLLSYCCICVCLDFTGGRIQCHHAIMALMVNQYMNKQSMKLWLIRPRLHTHEGYY